MVTLNDLKAFHFFTYLNQEQLRYIATYMDYLQLQKGEVLFGEGEKGDYVCFVLKGELEVIKSSTPNDGDVTITTVSSGHSIGEMILIDNQPRSATVRAILPTELAVLTQSAFDMIANTEPLVGMNIFKGLSKVLTDKLKNTSSALANEMRY